MQKHFANWVSNSASFLLTCSLTYRLSHQVLSSKFWHKIMWWIGELWLKFTFQRHNFSITNFFGTLCSTVTLRKNQNNLLDFHLMKLLDFIHFFKDSLEMSGQFQETWVCSRVNYHVNIFSNYFMRLFNKYFALESWSLALKYGFSNILCPWVVVDFSV